MHEASFLSSTTLWYAVAFFAFFGVMFRWARKPILGALDAEIAKVKGELERARKMRAEAEASLSEYRAKQREAMAEAEAMVSHAKEEAERLRVQAEADLKAALARHEQQAMVRIKQAEVDAIAEVKSLIISSALESARGMLAEGVDKAMSAKIIDQSIADIDKLSSARSKAAG